MCSAEIEAAVSALTDEQRRALGAAMHGVGYRTIAEKLGVRPREAARIMRSALLELRSLLELAERQDRSSSSSGRSTQ